MFVWLSKEYNGKCVWLVVKWFFQTEGKSISWLGGNSLPGGKRGRGSTMFQRRRIRGKTLWPNYMRKRIYVYNIMYVYIWILVCSLIESTTPCFSLLLLTISNRWDSPYIFQSFWNFNKLLQYFFTSCCSVQYYFFIYILTIIYHYYQLIINCYNI